MNTNVYPTTPISPDAIVIHNNIFFQAPINPLPKLIPVLIHLYHCLPSDTDEAFISKNLSFIKFYAGGGGGALVLVEGHLC